MSKIVGNKLYVYAEGKRVCELCGKIAELRPYGKNGENICFQCGMKNEEDTEERFNLLTKDVNILVIVNKRR